MYVSYHIICHIRFLPNCFKLFFNSAFCHLSAALSAIHVIMPSSHNVICVPPFAKLLPGHFRFEDLSTTSKPPSCSSPDATSATTNGNQYTSGTSLGTSLACCMLHFFHAASYLIERNLQDTKVSFDIMIQLDMMSASTTI